LSAAGDTPNEDARRREFFEARIRPVLVARCYACHGALKHKGGLRVDWRNGLLKGGDSGPAVEPGQPDESLLVRVIEHSEPGLEMPKDAPRLPAHVVKDIREWVAAGAFDPREKQPTAEEFERAQWQTKLAERRRWWSLHPVARPDVPNAAGSDWASRPVDHFIFARLKDAGLTPAAPAEPRVLARRLAFVLTGLPPNSDELRAFLADSRPDAYEHFVDKLLASPHFGEHWARHWMDVVRYGDTYGYEWDIPAKGAWRYRDYLVRAFNSDVPFDQLMREQLAGDLLREPRWNTAEQINESLIGTMFFQLGENRHGDSAMFDGIHQEMVNNKIDAFSKAFLGLTVGCARCHDHKHDAVSQRDYYALAGVFMSARWVTHTLDAPGRNAQTLARLRELKQSLRVALSNWWLEAARSWTDELFAASRSTSENAWRKALAAAGKDLPREHPLRPWADLFRVERDGDDLMTEWAALASWYAEESKRRIARNASAFRVVADFRKEVPPGWSVDGVGLRDGRVRSGDFTIALEGDKAIGSVLPAGLFSHALSPRLNGAVRTPYLDGIPEPKMSFEACGGDFSAERIVIDNAFLTERQTYLARRDPAWSSQSTLHELQGRKVYVELATKSSNANFPPRVGLGGSCSEAQAAEPRSWLGITRVVAHQEASAPQDDLARFRALLDGPIPRTVFDAADRYAAWLRGAVERWSRDRATDGDVSLINWLLDQGLLPNRSDVDAPASVRDLVAAYRAAEKLLLDPQTVNGLADLDDGYDYRLNRRGEYDQLAAAVPRGYVGALAGDESAASFHDRHSGRLELADLVTALENPLTARVYVNRVWQWVFGTGLVATPDDFGRMGDGPSHPELLDFLAAWFVDHGWSTKDLVRLLVTSATFRQASTAAPRAREIDPSNRLLHHYPLRRLEAESVRDSILAASGRLERRLYGAPIDPHRPKEDPEKRLFSGPLDGGGRRSLYTKLTIMEPPKFLATFNQPPPKLPTGRRDVTSVPAQALALLNDPFVLQQARFWGERVVAMPHQSAEERLGAMFFESLGRSPTADELERWRNFVEDLSRDRDAAPDQVLGDPQVWSHVAHTLFNMTEFLYYH
jgi:hypothetical protein